MNGLRILEKVCVRIKTAAIETEHYQKTCMHSPPAPTTIPKKTPVLIITDAKWLALKEENGWSASC